MLGGRIFLQVSYQLEESLQNVLKLLQDGLLARTLFIAKTTSNSFSVLNTLNKENGSKLAKHVQLELKESY